MTDQRYIAGKLDTERAIVLNMPAKGVSIINIEFPSDSDGNVRLISRHFVDRAPAIDHGGLFLERVRGGVAFRAGHAGRMRKIGI